jgi:glycosyltransferase involved in cell wall biosynthesis
MTKYRVLVLAPHYNTFVKGLTDAMAVGNLCEATVAVRYNPLSEIAARLPRGKSFEHIRRWSRSCLLDFDSLPERVHVEMIPMLYFVRDGKNRLLGDRLYRNTMRMIHKRSVEFDIIHAHFSYPYGYAGARIKERSRAPLVITVHEDRDLLSNEMESRDRRIFWAWKSADALIRINRSDIPKLKEHNVNVLYIPAGFDSKRFFLASKEESRKQLNLPAEKKILFNLASLYPYKGHKHLIEAMKEVSQRRSDIVCYIGGSGPLRGDLQRHINSLGLSDKVKLIGYVRNDEVGDWFRASDAFVLPSLSEGTPGVMFEALACGRPVVASRVGGIPEIITSDGYGLLVEPGNSRDLADKIIDVVLRNWDNHMIAEFAAQFSWDKIAKRVSNVYEDAMSRFEGG